MAAKAVPALRDFVKSGRSSSPAKGTKRTAVATVAIGRDLSSAKATETTSSAKESPSAATRNSPKEGKGNCSPEQPRSDSLSEPIRRFLTLIAYSKSHFIE